MEEVDDNDILVQEANEKEKIALEIIERYSFEIRKYCKEYSPNDRMQSAVIESCINQIENECIEKSIEPKDFEKLASKCKKGFAISLCSRISEIGTFKSSKELEESIKKN